MSSLQALDTNYILALTDPRPEASEKARAVMDPFVEPVVPCIAYGESWHGLCRGRPDKTAKKRKKFDEYIVPMRVLWLDQETLKRFHDLSWTLARKGTPLPGNDVWIAALCLQHDAILLTDDSDFNHVPGLQVRSW
ncbi:MAG: PIN domain-containing protein [candidate division KSB1 bacterium]|nr:PIN domain-containing protein [candidate division KSB1 bacterium]MDZ7364425.1 PIN domain-containing protein [candidate division KSB1 bacterium]MDZ7402797.1 PIN domain-containing protein [candidate division KSB1 bacterium]